MRFLVWVVVLGWSWGAVAAEDPFAFTPPPDKGMIETPYGPAPAVRDWPKDRPQALVDGIAAYEAGDFETAKKWLLPLAEKGHAVAMGYIGRIIDRSSGQGDNIPTEACDWYEKSAKGGYKSGQFNIGTCYLIGAGRAKNLEHAARWLWPDAENGDKSTRFKLASTLFQKGDRELYLVWLKKAAESGSKDAAFGLYGYGYKVPDFGWFDIACVWYATKTKKPLGYCDD